MVGLDGPDDAAVWRLDDQRALVITTDFFTPVVDTPYEYGAIAAANSLSDIYAMGGQPFLALNIAALPPDLPAELSGEILRGGAEKCREAGVVVAGGHTVQDKEPKFGLVALGFVDLRHLMTKGGARPGDVLVLTKPLGFGVTTTALKRGVAAPEDVHEVIGWMSRLNAKAAQLANEFGVRGGTDITGFSLLGHGWEMAKASGVASVLSLTTCLLSPALENMLNNGPFPAVRLITVYFMVRMFTLMPDLAKWSKCFCSMRKPVAGFCLRWQQKKSPLSSSVLLNCNSQFGSLARWNPERGFGLCKVQ